MRHIDQINDYPESSSQIYYNIQYTNTIHTPKDDALLEDKRGFGCMYQVDDRVSIIQ